MLDVVSLANKLLTLLLLSLLLAGCVSASKYPENWAPGFPAHDLVFDKTGGNCDLTGSYADMGESPQGQKSGATISLFRLLFPGSTFPTAMMPDSVTLHGPEGGVLKVIAHNGGKPDEARQFSNYVCLENGLMMMVNPGGARGNADCVVTVCTGNQDNFLFRGADGWLILKRINLVVVLPWFQWETLWYRFRPVNSAQDAQ